MSKTTYKHSCIKWCGGKGQLLDEIISRLPSNITTLVDLFTGSATVPLNVPAEHYILNDLNFPLMSMYRAIKSNPAELKQTLGALEEQFNAAEDKAALYYSKRYRFNELINNSLGGIETAALMIYTNKLGFNGLFRCSKNGFNVPFSKRTKVNLYDDEVIDSIHEMLTKATLICGDFKDVNLDNLPEGSMVLSDSPYFDTWDTYQPGGFPEEAHVALFEKLKRADENGVKWISFNSNTDFIKDMYFQYNISVVDVKRLVNRDATNRKDKEVIITNF